LRKTATEYAKTFRKSPAGDALYVYGTTVFPEPLSAAAGFRSTTSAPARWRMPLRSAGTATTPCC